MIQLGQGTCPEALCLERNYPHLDQGCMIGYSFAKSRSIDHALKTQQTKPSSMWCIFDSVPLNWHTSINNSLNKNFRSSNGSTSESFCAISSKALDATDKYTTSRQYILDGSDKVIELLQEYYFITSRSLTLRDYLQQVIQIYNLRNNIFIKNIKGLFYLAIFVQGLYILVQTRNYYFESPVLDCLLYFMCIRHLSLWQIK